ncbi:MAG TPA: V-type ATP synthase subunit D [Firmicutes bacterium]|jgi:V/A-type H+-transporting ATPase subunit D|nr:V-type ATP synthase subunit D [Bacillota bacterium]
MELRVNPTRMELNRLKTRLTVAVRGHKLLKDKRDELMRQFLVLVRQNKELREEVEERLARSFQKFMLARAVMSAEAVEEAIMFPQVQLEVQLAIQNIMSVHTPKISWQQVGETSASIYPYGFAETSGELDDSINTLSELLPQLLELAEIETAVTRLAQEIERTRRRVNALEHVMIPDLEKTVRYITMKLEENERANLTRLMKVKDIVRAKSI